MMEQPERPSRVGQVLAEKYRITRYLGEGGMGTVYEAQHAFVGRRFAVKILHAEFARGGEMLERFTREARAAGALENENIASVIDFGHTADGVPYIVMEFLLGEDLAKLLAREGQLPVPRAVNMIVQACRALDAAHAAGVVHRDLKPENLFVCKRGDGSDLVKLLDFGIAKLARLAEASLAPVTRSGAMMGTPYYMPPEQARGARDLDHRADIYALGVIMYEALSGQRPHPGDSYNAILYHILTQPVAPLGTLRGGLDPDLTAIVHRALAFEPGNRPASAMELARALARHAGRQITPLTSQFEMRAVSRASELAPGDSPPSPSPPVQAGHTALLTPRDAPPPVGVTRGRRRRLGRATVAMGAAAMLVVVVTTALVASRDKEPPPVDPEPIGVSIDRGTGAPIRPEAAPRATGATPEPATSAGGEKSQATGSPVEDQPVAPPAASAPAADVAAAEPGAAAARTTSPGGPAPSSAEVRPSAPAQKPSSRAHRRDRDSHASRPRPVFDKTNPYR